MAERIEHHEVSVVAGTLAAAPSSHALTMNQGILRRLEITVPPGPSGLMGFRVLHSGQMVIPYKGSGWIVADNRIFDWPMEGFPTGDKWSIQAYNTGDFDHTLYIVAHLDEIPTHADAPLVAVPIE